MFCKKCGKEIKEGVRFCPYCGAESGVSNEMKATESNKGCGSRKQTITGSTGNDRQCREAKGLLRQRSPHYRRSPISKEWENQ